MSAQASKGILRVGWSSSPTKGLIGTSQGWSAQSSRNVSSEKRPSSDSGRKPTMARDQGPNLTSIKRGPGYRSSFSGTVATVFGATGMIGTACCNRLGKGGSQIIIPYRGDHYEVLRLKVAGDLGQVLFSPYDIRDEDSVRKAMKYSDIVINATGREYETRNFKFHDINVKGPANLARMAREMGVKRFVHISSINAKENPQTLFLPGGSEWLKTKWQGEMAVLEEFPDATIFRPVEMYGSPDHLVHYYNSRLRTAWREGVICLWKRGSVSVRAPLWSSDLVSGIMAALDDPNTKGMTFEAMGPERFLLSDLMDWMHEVMHKDPVDFRYKRNDLRFSPVTFVKAMMCSMSPTGNRYWRAPTLERLERSQLTEESEGLPGLPELGVKLHRVEQKMPWELDMYRAFRFHEYFKEEDKPVIHPLVPLSRMEEKQLIADKSNSKSMLGLVGL